IIRHGRGKYPNRRVLKCFKYRAVHLASGTDIDALDSDWSIERSRTADEKDASTAEGSRFRNSVAHLARRAIGDIADGIEVFASGAGGDEDGLSFEVALEVQDFADRRDDLFLPGETAGAGHAAGEIAFVGIDDVDAPRAKHLDVFLSRGVIPHVDV